MASDIGQPRRRSRYSIVRSSIGLNIEAQTLNRRHGRHSLQVPYYRMRGSCVESRGLDQSRFERHLYLVPQKVIRERNTKHTKCQRTHANKGCAVCKECITTSMASRDLTAAFLERRSTAMRKRPMAGGGGGGGTDDVRLLTFISRCGFRPMSVSASCCYSDAQHSYLYAVCSLFSACLLFLFVAITKQPARARTRNSLPVVTTYC